MMSEINGWMVSGGNWQYTLTRNDILADDWEVEEEKITITITKDQLNTAYFSSHSIRSHDFNGSQYLYSQNINHIDFLWERLTALVK